jgi:phage protein D
MALAAPPTTGVRSSRPTLSLAGRESETLDQALLSLRVEERIDGIYHCEVSVGNWGPIGGGTGFLYFDRREVEFGKALKVSLGGETLFDGRIVALEGQYPEGSPPTLTMLAEDRLQDLRMTRRTRTFADMSDAQVIEQIAGDHSLTPDVQLTGPTHRVLAQVNQSDLAFIRDRCRAVDAEVWLDVRTLKVRERAKRSSAATDLGYGNQLREVTITADLATQATQVTVGGWDVAAKQAIKETAAAPAIQPELKGTDAGATILSSALAARTATAAHTAPFTTSEAKARAEALFRQRARRFVRAEGLAETSGKLRVGSTAKLTGVGPLFDGEYYVTDVRHVFDPVLGLRTEFGAERPGIGRP